LVIDQESLRDAWSIKYKKCRFFSSLWQQDLSSSSETCLCVGILKQGRNSLFQTAVGLAEVLLLGSKNSNMYNLSRVFGTTFQKYRSFFFKDFNKRCPQFSVLSDHNDVRL